MSHTSKKRQTLFIQKKFQARSIAIVVSIIAASGLLSGILLYALLSSELSSELQVAHQQIQDTWERLAPAIIFGNILTVLVTGAVAAIAVLYQSHKIAGPMYRLQTICEEVSRGNYHPVTSLRKADQLTVLAQSFEDMLAVLRQKRHEQETLINEARLMLNTIQQQAEPVSQQPVLEDLVSKLEQISGYVKQG